MVRALLLRFLQGREPRYLGGMTVRVDILSLHRGCPTLLALFARGWASHRRQRRRTPEHNPVP
jgi:hypothetical protein